MNVVIDLLKWPATAWVVLLAWNAARELKGATLELLVRPSIVEAVVAGMTIFAASYLMFFRRSPTATTVRTLEHEAAHLLASIVTFNRVMAIEARDSGEGRLTLHDKGNWIVSAAPYVLPLPLFVPSIVIRAAPASELLPRLLLGFSLAFHIYSTCVETHRQQPDLKELGPVCACFLLPACHILVATWVSGLMLGHQRHLYAANRLTTAQILRVAHDPATAAQELIRASRDLASTARRLLTGGIQPKAEARDVEAQK